ncbi:MAG: signal peptidase II [Rickettsiaceae bacterium]
MKSLFLYNIFFIIIAILLDQFTKSYIISYLNFLGRNNLEINSFLDIVYIWNYGVSFGILTDYQNINYILLPLNSVIVIYILYLSYKASYFLEMQGYALILGGAISNILDRVLRGAVFDFIYFHYNDYGFPAFNIADSCIFIGIMCLFYHALILKSYK